MGDEGREGHDFCPSELFSTEAVLLEKMFVVEFRMDGRTGRSSLTFNKRLRFEEKSEGFNCLSQFDPFEIWRS